MEKYTLEEVDLLSKVFSGDVMMEDAFETLLKDPELKEICRQYINGEVEFTYEELEEFDLKLVTDFAKNIRKEDVVKVINSADIMKEEFIDVIIHHPEFYEGGLEPDFLIQLISYTNSLSFYERVLNDESLQLDPKVEETVSSWANQIKAKIEMQKIQEDTAVIIDVINYFRPQEDLFDIIPDEQLAKEAEQLFNLDNNLSQEKKEEIRTKLFQFLASRFDEAVGFHQLETANNNDIKIGLIEAILDKEGLKLQNWQIIDLLATTNSPKLIQKVIDSEKMQNFTEYDQETLRLMLDDAFVSIKIEDSRKIISILDGNESPDKILPFITDPELKEQFQEQLKQKADGKIEFGPELLEHFASKFQPANFQDVRNMKTNDVKTALVDQIIHHSEFYEFLSIYDIEQLVKSTNSVEFMTQALKDESLQLDYYAEQNIQTQIEIVIEKEKELARERNSQTIVDVLSGAELPEKLLPLIEDESMRKRLEDMLNINSNLVGQDAGEIDQDIMEHLASKISKKHFGMIETIDPGPNKNGLVDAIIHHPEYFPDGLKQSQYRILITSTKSVEYMKKVLNDPELSFSQLSYDSIKNAIRTEERKNKKPSVLDYTEEEAKAVRTYEGVGGGNGPLSSNGSAYKTMNAMLFPGLDNEFARIYEDHQHLIDNAVRNPEELLELSALLYTAMYKYGKKMQDPAHTTRVDRSASFPEMEKRGEIISNFSTSLRSSYCTQFSKAHITLVQAEIQPGTACLEFGDFFDELGADYDFSSEREILIAPFSPITMTEEPMTQEELQIRDYNGGPPDRKIKMIVNPPPQARPLSTEEKADRARQESIFYDPTIRAQAALLLSKLHQYSSKEEAIRSIPQEEFEQYVEWKAAFQALLKYKIREISLELDKALAAERGEEFVVPEPPETPELTVVPQLAWEAETLELPIIQEQDIQSHGTSWDPDKTEELPTIQVDDIQSHGTSWDPDKTEELPTIQADSIQSHGTSWDPDKTEELPIVPQEALKTDYKPNLEQSDWMEDKQPKEIQPNDSWDPDKTEELPIITEQYIQKFYEGELSEKTDPNLMQQLATTAKKNPLSKINKAISNFAEKLSLKLKGDEPKGKEDDDARDW